MPGWRVASRGGAGVGRSAAHPRPSDRRRFRPGAGFQLYEILVVVAISGVVAALGVPGLLSWTRALRLRVAAAEVTASLQTARSQAIRRGTRVGVRFESWDGGRVSWALFRDGDGDGVRTADIEAGIDPGLGLERHLSHVGREVRFGFPPGPAPPDPSDPGRRLSRLDDPVRFGRSDIVSFNPLGEATSGSLYLTDGRRGLVAVRVFGRTGKTKVLTFDPDLEAWR